MGLLVRIQIRFSLKPALGWSVEELLKVMWRPSEKVGWTSIVERLCLAIGTHDAHWQMAAGMTTMTIILTTINNGFHSSIPVHYAVAVFPSLSKFVIARCHTEENIPDLLYIYNVLENKTIYSNTVLEIYTKKTQERKRYTKTRRLQKACKGVLW